MSRDGWLPPGVTDADIDRACERYEDLFYCVLERDRTQCTLRHCALRGLGQCQECAAVEGEAR